MIHDHYDILIEMSLRVWDGTEMTPVQSAHLRVGQLDHLAGEDISVDQALALARSILEAKSARLIAELAAVVMRLRHEPMRLPFD
jgi:hypothetical protein